MGDAMGLINNMALLVAFSAIYALIPRETSNDSLRRLLLTGCALGVFCIVVMMNSVTLIKGVVFDARTVVISLAGFFFGTIPTLIAAAMAVAFRLVLGGGGMLMGVSTIAFAAATGLVWRHTRLGRPIDKRQRWFKLFTMGLTTHCAMVLFMLLLPSDMVFSAVFRIAPIILTLHPLGTIAAGLLLFVQQDRLELVRALHESGEKLRVTLLSVGDGVIATDEKGAITMFNKACGEITGWDESQKIGGLFHKHFNIVNETTRKPVENPVLKVLETGKPVDLANHTVLIREDGTEVPIADSAAPIVDEDGRLGGVVLVVRDVTRERNKQRRVEYLSCHDEMTGLYNRMHFEKELLLSDVAEKLPLTFIIGDVNGLKMTNDAFGHQMGDKLLRMMADTLRSAVGKRGIIARYGGDEFVILMTSADEKDAEEVCAQIKRACSCVQLDCIDFSISLGYETKRDPQEEIETVIRRAEDYMYRKKAAESRSMRGNTINLILSALHEKSPRERAHSNRVSNLCRAIGVQLKLSEREVIELGVAGLMHDIGKIAVSEAILNKETMLTDEEVEEIKRHPEVGYRILRASSNMSYVAEFVLSHHERLDGSGYPQKLKGDQIPMQAKILAVADSYDAMTSDRPYHKAMTIENAIAELRRNAGTQFDPVIVEALIASVREGQT